jgi:hypothetical protein
MKLAVQIGVHNPDAKLNAKIGSGAAALAADGAKTALEFVLEYAPHALNVVRARPGRVVAKFDRVVAATAFFYSAEADGVKPPYARQPSVCKMPSSRAIFFLFFSLGV